MVRRFSLSALLFVLLASIPPAAGAASSAPLGQAASAQLSGAATSSKRALSQEAHTPPAGFVPAPLRNSPPAATLRQPEHQQRQGSAANVSPRQPDWGKLPLAFVPNAGQSDAAVRFQVHGAGRNVLFFTSNEVVLNLAGDTSQPPDRDNQPPVGQPVQSHRPTVMRIQFDGTAANVNPAPADQLPGVANYLVGGEPHNWHINLPTYSAIAYQSLYPGIDLRYDGSQGQLKSTYTVAPGADVRKIAWHYAGAGDVRVDSGGQLVVPRLGRKHVEHTGTLNDAPSLVEAAPVAWQVIGGKRVSVDVRYAVRSDGEVGFALGAYDPAQALIIDPILTYSTSLGGDGGTDVGNAVALDSSGNAYVTGYTQSATFPIANARQSTPYGGNEVFVSKLNAAGTGLVYSTYLGGSGDEVGNGIVVDSSGSAYVAGYSTSTNFPTTSGVKQPGNLGGPDAFVAKLTPSGNGLVYSTYLGAGGIEAAHAIAVDSGGNAYIAGFTSSFDFPRQNPFQMTFGGGYDVFVSKLNATGSSLVYSTFLGGSADEIAYGLAVDSTGNAYVTGYTQSTTTFPRQNALQPNYGGGYHDAFVSKLNAAGTGLVYSTFLGGNDTDVGRAIAVDGNGNAYVTGLTYSGNFPLQGAYQSQYVRNQDAFVSKLNAAGTGLVYSTYLGGNGDDVGYGIAVDAIGDIYVAGSTLSTTFPQAGALQTAGGGSDAFVTKFNAAGTALVYSTYLGGNDYDRAGGIAVDSSGNAYVTGSTSSINFPTASAIQVTTHGGSDAFVAKINDQLPADQNRVPEFDPCGSSQPSRGRAVNTRTGTFWTSETDLQISSPGPALQWTRSYASQATGDITGTLGYGWQHPYATRLVTPAMAGGEAGLAIVVSPKGNRLRFQDLGNGQFKPYPGVYSSLAQAGGVYTQTLSTQEQVVFNTGGQLTAMLDAQGRRLQMQYTGARLTQITDAANPQRYFQLGYDASGARITSVRDAAGRTVQYTYDANGDLQRAADVMGRPTTYTYQGHLLTGVDNALGQAVVRTTYDVYAPAGKVTRQTLQDGEQVQLEYFQNATRVTTTGADGQRDVEEIFYDLNNTTTSIVKDGVTVQSSTYDRNCTPRLVTDANGQTTTAVFNSAGLPQNVTNALKQAANVEYDAQNRPITITDTLNRKTTLAWDGHNNLLRETTGITTTSPQGFTTSFTYNVRYTGKDWLEELRTPDGIVTRNDYDAQGQKIGETVGYGTAAAQTTNYEYDILGRVTATTLAAGAAQERRDVTRYNPDDTVAQTIQNYKDGVFDPARPDEDLISGQGYDALGRRVSARDALGRYDVTHFDAQGRSDWTLQNLAPAQTDAQGQLIVPASPPAYAPARPDANVATLYGFDGLGRTTLVTQTGILTGTFDTASRTFGAATLRVTRTEFDQLSRPVTTTLNYRPGIPVGAFPDANVQTLTQYDNAGNVTGRRDALGRWTMTEYDALNRPTRVTRNWENGNPLTVDAANRSWTDGSDTDLVTITRYTPDGQTDRTIDNYVDGAFTASEPITDVITLQQYDALGRAVATTLAYDPATAGTRTDTNRRTAMTYDAPSGRVIGTQDALGRWTNQQYDALGRVTATVQNCRDAAGNPAAQGCAGFDANAPDRNVPSQTRYDTLGRAFETVDALLHVTHTTYDVLGREVATTQNYVAGGAATADTNVTTRKTYDALGQVTQTTDAQGTATNSAYNGLQQTVVVTDSVGRVIRTGYDGAGTEHWTMKPDGRLVVRQVDGLGRIVATIDNYQDGTVVANEPVDQDLVTRTVYDASGRKVRTVDPAGRATSFGYDLQDHLTWVQENVQVGTCSAPPCNVLTQYRYDRAGNRTAIIDARGNVRRFAYDAANRQVAATDALGRTTTSDYDAADRLIAQHDPRGAANDLRFQYDDLDRRIQTQAQNLSTPITAQYDALGRRVRLGDGPGTTSFTYDALGRMTQVTAPGTGSVGYAYNARGDRTHLTYPDNTAVDYSYWDDGQLRAVTQGNTTLASYTYDTAGRLQQLTRANGATTSYGYDAADRLRDLRTVVSGTDVSRFQYQVDRLGQRTAVTESLPPQSRTVNYSYDGLLRLTGAAENPGTTYAYAYDLAGNRTEVRVNGAVTESRSYDATDQVTGWQYDAAGNLLSDGATTYTYDALNRALTTNAGSETRSYSYNGDGTLLQQTANGVTTSYAQDLATQESQVLQTTQGTTTTLYLYGADRLAAVSGPTRSWYVEDGIGSVRRTLDDAGAVLTTLSYDPWGTPQGSTAPTTFGYTGELHDAVTGLVNLRVRWYQPGQARFLTRDPFGGVPERPETLAPYPYAEDSPIDKTDPSGNLAIFVAGFFGPRPRTGPDRPDIWKMADRFERFIRGNTRRFDPDTQMQVIHEVESVRKNAPRCRPNDKRCNSKREPIILIGHSRGAATIQSAVFALRHYDPNIRIDLIITLGMIPFNISQPVGGVNYAAKVSNVDRHINFRSRYRSLFSSPNNDIIFAERAVKGSEEWYIKEAEHANLDDEFIGKDKKYPNLVWPVTEVAIHRIQQDAEKPLGYVPGGMSKPIITLRKRRF